MAANQNIKILYFSRNPLWYSVDEESEDTEWIEPRLTLWLMAQKHNTHSRVKPTALHSADDYGHHQSIILSFSISID